jgi:hypothetical protein
MNQLDSYPTGDFRMEPGTVASGRGHCPIHPVSDASFLVDEAAASLGNWMFLLHIGRRGQVSFTTPRTGDRHGIAAAFPCTSRPGAVVGLQGRHPVREPRSAMGRRHAHGFRSIQASRHSFNPNVTHRPNTRRFRHGDRPGRPGRRTAPIPAPSSLLPLPPATTGRPRSPGPPASPGTAHRIDSMRQTRGVTRPPVSPTPLRVALAATEHLAFRLATRP